MLYTDRGAIECRVNIRKCLSKTCVTHWDGAENSIFRLSKSTCAGYELGNVTNMLIFEII